MSQQRAIEPTPASLPASALELRLRKGGYRQTEDGLEKRCPRCNEYWPADTEFFYAQKSRPDGLNDWCKACYHEHRYPNGRGKTARALRIG